MYIKISNFCRDWELPGVFNSNRNTLSTLICLFTTNIIILHYENMQCMCQCSITFLVNLALSFIIFTWAIIECYT